MKKTFLFMLVVASALLWPAITTNAQETRGAGVAAGGFVMSEFADKPVKGAPYSAQAVTETRQRLVDGNEIVNKSESTIYRDSQGRIRREQNLKTIGGLSDAPPLQLITITDPVAGATYTLNPAEKTARKGGFNSFFITNDQSRVTGTLVPAPAGPAVVRAEVGTGTGYTLSTTGGPAITTEDRVATLKQALNDVKKENLGTQTIEGVEATGMRLTSTIPAGQIGNEKPIEIVTERWYSNELQTTVLSRRADPRTGETIFRLTNINRTEPATSLFEVPGDYRIIEAAKVNMVRTPE